MSDPVILMISFSSPAEVAAYDFFSSDSNIGKPSAWHVSCQELEMASWSLMESRTVTAPSQLKASYSMSAGISLPAFSWASTYPLLGSTLPVGTLLSQCKFVITAHHGTSAGETLHLGEVRLYDVYGDVLDVISSATNPGGRRGSVAFFPSKVIDKDLRTSWRDQMSVPSSLVLDLSSPSGVAGYEFYSHISDQDKDPTAWSVYCRESGVAAWSLMESRSEASIPARGSPYALSAGLPAFSWASTYPLLGSTLPVGTLLSQCKFVITAHHGTAAGQKVGLAEVGFTDDGIEGGMRVSPNSFKSPGGIRTTSSHAVSNMNDQEMGSSWDDRMGVPSTLWFEFSPSVALTKYELFSYHDGLDSSPTSWKVLRLRHDSC